MIETHFAGFWDEMGIPKQQFLDLGAYNGEFNMTVLSMTLAGRRNGVSKLHGKVTRRMVQTGYPGFPEDEVPVKQILGSFPNIDTSGITSQADQGDVVELRYIDQNRRVERQASFMNPILPVDVDQVLDADVFVCVPITDYEVGQPTLRHI
jgi:hypothetical protein